LTRQRLWVSFRFDEAAMKLAVSAAKWLMASTCAGRSHFLFEKMGSCACAETHFWFSGGIVALALRRHSSQIVERDHFRWVAIDDAGAYQMPALVNDVGKLVGLVERDVVLRAVAGERWKGGR
jgi:hypothetical protein